METVTAFVTLLFTFLKYLTYPVFWLMRIFNRKKLPPIEDDILRISATKLAELIRKRKLSCTDVITTYINRIKQVNPVLNAVVEDRFDAALEEAKNVDNFLSETLLTEEELRLKKPLLGIPLTVKESCSLKGLSLSVGCYRLKGKKAENDGEVVSKLRESGAIPLLVSNTPEMCMGWDTINFITGNTVNPYNPAYATGGSSGGEAALVASAASIVGVGSDLAGSIRLPAALCGVFGHKPTPRICSIKGHVPYTSNEAYNEYLTIGPLTRFADDLYLMMNAMVEEPQKLKLDEQVNLSNLRVHWNIRMGKSFLHARVDVEIVELLNKVLDHFREKHKAKIFSRKFQNMDKAMDMGLVHLSEATSDITSLLVNPQTGKKDLNIFWEVPKAAFNLSVLTFNAAMSEFLRETDGLVPKRKRPFLKKKLMEMRNEISKELGNDGILLLPTFYSTAFQNGQAPLMPKGFSFTLIFNLLGFPATSIPMGLSKNGLPIGLQVVAAPYQDRLCLSVAKDLEKTFGGWVEPGRDHHGSP